MVPPEKTHETFVYCFAAAARFCRPGFRASGRFRNRGVPFRSRDAPFLSRGFFRFRFRNLVFRPRFSVSRLSAAFVATAGCIFSRPFPLPPYALFRCRGFACRGGSRRSLRNYERIQLRDALFVLHLAVQLGRDAVAYEFERRPVLFAIGSAGSCGTFSGSIGVPFSRCGSRDAVPSKRPSNRHSRSAGPAIRANPSKCLWHSRSGAGNPSSGCPHA